MSWEAEMDPPAEHPLLRRELGCLSDSMGRKNQGNNKKS